MKNLGLILLTAACAVSAFAITTITSCNHCAVEEDIYVQKAPFVLPASADAELARAGEMFATFENQEPALNPYITTSSIDDALYISDTEANISEIIENQYILVQSSALPNKMSQFSYRDTHLLDTDEVSQAQRDAYGTSEAFRVRVSNDNLDNKPDEYTDELTLGNEITGKGEITIFVSSDGDLNNIMSAAWSDDEQTYEIECVDSALTLSQVTDIVSSVTR